MVLICDEAHRTAGLKKTPKVNEATLRNFTVCHDNALLPARNRIYMTATPKTFTRGTAEAHDEGYVVVSMNDEATFGPNLAEVSYREAVEQEALTDYRIAAIVPHNESYEFADKRARKHARAAKKKARRRRIVVAERRPIDVDSGAPNRVRRSPRRRHRRRRRGREAGRAFEYRVLQPDAYVK